MHLIIHFHSKLTVKNTSVVISFRSQGHEIFTFIFDTSVRFGSFLTFFIVALINLIFPKRCFYWFSIKINEKHRHRYVRIRVFNAQSMSKPDKLIHTHNISDGLMNEGTREREGGAATAKKGGGGKCLWFQTCDTQSAQRCSEDRNMHIVIYLIHHGIKKSPPLIIKSIAMVLVSVILALYHLLSDRNQIVVWGPPLLHVNEHKPAQPDHKMEASFTQAWC